MSETLDQELEQAASRYVVGIDLGTTNSAVAYVDTEQANWRVQIFAIAQLTAPGQIENLDILPSFHFQPPAAELSSNAFRLPWQKSTSNYVVGRYARDAGTQLPGRQIASAKSWLCHAGVDRRAAILPWHAADDVERLSPIEVSACYLRQIREAWDAAHPLFPLAGQDIVLTLPASFDEVARELTVEAAARAGLPKVILIEEPQSAFYAWIHNHSGEWDQLVQPGQKILICDIGGGTSDFTLIRVRRTVEDRVQFHRVAVGDHLVLGGDNLDLALAKYLEGRLGQQVAARQWDLLVRTARRVKEELLGESAPTNVTVHLPATGAKLIGGGVQLEVRRDEVDEILVDGFFPLAPLDSRPLVRQSGFQEFGLPYASDPAVTRHLAAFLTAHRHVAEEEIPATRDVDPARPDIILFNGGVFESPRIRQRLIDAISAWFSTQGQHWVPRVLENDRLHLAVARGAAYYGMVRRGSGVRIAASLARSYYIGFEQGPTTVEMNADAPASLLCIVPGNAEPGQTIDLSERQFELKLAQPVEFPLFVSSVRLTDRPGELISMDPAQLKALPPIRTALRSRRKSDSDSIRVQIHAHLTEIGTVELSCREVASDRSWRLDFDVRSATQTDRAGHESAAESQGVFDDTIWSALRQSLLAVFGEKPAAVPEGLMKELAVASGMTRDDWPPTLLRRIWGELMELEAGRRVSAVHEGRWMNLLGYALRPGYGVAVDDWRVSETWRLLQGKLIHSSASCRTESLILWRRIAAGLSAGQQRAIAEPLIGTVRALHRRYHGGKDRGETVPNPHESHEIFRLLGSLELLPLAMKHELGKILMELLPKRKLEPSRPAMLWTIGRIGSRVPTYGPLNTVVPTEVVIRWIDQLLLESVEPSDSQLPFALMLLSRRTDDRYRDISEPIRQRVLDRMRGADQSLNHLTELVERVGALDRDEQKLAFGESLPRGLSLSN